MSSIATPRPSSIEGRHRRSAGPGSRSAGAATPTVISAFGILVAVAGIEHGIGELRQGTAAPDGLLIESWPDTAAFEILSGEPAMTIVPSLVVAGLLTVCVSVAFGIWAVTSSRHQHGGLVLIGLSVLMLLVGGGLGPPLIGVLLGLTAMRATHPGRRPPRQVGRRLASLWPAFTTIGIAGYLGLMPGTVLLSALAGVESAALVMVFGLVAFGGLLLALPAALAADRLAAARDAHVPVQASER